MVFCCSRLLASIRQVSNATLLLSEFSRKYPLLGVKYFIRSVNSPQLSDNKSKLNPELVAQRISVMESTAPITATETVTAPVVAAAKTKAPTVEDFKKIDIRVGRITESWKHPESENLYCLKVDIGTEIRSIGTGLQQYQPIENMAGLVIVMANLKPRKLGGYESNGMVLCASNADFTAFDILRPAADAKAGDRVFLEGIADQFPQEMQPQLNPKRKILETILPGIHTDGECNATLLGQKWMTATGPITAQTLKNAPIS